jgi:hypothetical protein
MNDPAEKTKPDWWNPDLAEEIHRLQYEYHVRAFGEEMARINFLPLEERRKEVAKIYDHAKARGVKFDKPAPGYTR